ncbi:hypothetical protein [Thermomonas sp.]|uniref:hypothetical protein n=1 Tax=Thermomonas sp. TaxID=1971895 RepID=UPI0035B07159
MTITMVPVIGAFAYRDAAAPPPAGDVHFLPRTPVVVDGATITLPAKLSTTLVGGAIPSGFALPTLAGGVYYTVRELVAGGRDAYTIQVLPTDAVIDLSTAAPAEPQDVLVPRQPAMTWLHASTAMAAAGGVTSVNVTGPGVEASIAGTALTLAFTGGAGGLSADPAQPLGTASAGASPYAARADHVHPLPPPPAPPTAADIGLGSVDNTADADKPVSTAQAAAIAAAITTCDPAGAAAAAQAASDPAGTAAAAMAALGSAAMASTSAFATAAQGAKADAAVPQTAVGTSVASLVGGVVPTSQIPAIAVTEFLGRVASQAAMLALDGQPGDWAIRTDLGTTWFVTAADPTQLSSWTQLEYPTGTAAVASVNGQTGTIVLGPADVGADAAGAAAAAQAASAPASHTHTASAISDSTATGRSVLTATDAAAARTAIGAGTSSFDGTYGALTGKPTLGTAAATDSSAYATAAQGSKADTAYGWGNHAAAGYVGTSDSRLADAREWTASTVSQAAAEAGTSTTRYAWTPQRVKQAIVALGGATSPAVSTRLFDDFLTGYATTTATNMATVFPASRSVVACLSATTGASVTQTVEAGAPGLLTLSTGTASNGYARLCSTNGAVVKLGGGEVRFKQRFKIPTLPDVTDDFFVQVGLFNTFVGAADVVRVFCQASGAYGQWQVAAAVGGVGSPAISTPITPVAGTYTTIEGVINAAGTECKIYIDGTLVATMTDPLPTAALAHMTLLIKLAGTTARTLVVDYHELVMTQAR